MKLFYQILAFICVFAAVCYASSGNVAMTVLYCFYTYWFRENYER